MKKNIVDNSKKSIHQEKTVIPFYMGNKQNYNFIRNNTDIQFKMIGYTNNPLSAAHHKNPVIKGQRFKQRIKGEYLRELETYRTTKKGITILLRPVKISDELLIKDFFHSLSAKSLYNRFLQVREQITDKLLEKFVNVDYTKMMIILSSIKYGGIEKIIGISQYAIDEANHTAEVAFAVIDEYQGKGIGYELIKYLDYLARKNGLLGFTAEVFGNNTAMLHTFDKVYPRIEKEYSCGICTLKMMFNNHNV